MKNGKTSLEKRLWLVGLCLMTGAVLGVVFWSVLQGRSSQRAGGDSEGKLNNESNSGIWQELRAHSDWVVIAESPSLSFNEQATVELAKHGVDSIGGGKAPKYVVAVRIDSIESGMKILKSWLTQGPRDIHLVSKVSREGSSVDTILGKHPGVDSGGTIGPSH